MKIQTQKNWKPLTHKHFKYQLHRLIEEVAELRAKNPDTYLNNTKTKLLERVLKSIFETVPADPTAPDFRLGKTIGSKYKNWRRVKGGLPDRYRLFFLFNTTDRKIVYAWMNDEFSLRKEGSKTDAYNVFQKFLDRGDIPARYYEIIKTAQTINPPGRRAVKCRKQVAIDNVISFRPRNN